MKETIQSTDLFDRMENFMFSRKFIFVVALASTVPMVLHAHQLFYRITPYNGNVYFKNAYALFYAISFALTILVFTFNFIKRKPALYAIFAFVIDLLYFNPFDFIAEQYVIAFTKVFLSLVLAFTGYSYAELFVERAIKARKQKVNSNVDTMNENIVNTTVEHICGKCGKEFGSVKALNGHMVAHRSIIGE